MTTNIKICYVASADLALKFLLLNHLKFLKKEGYDVYAVCSEGKWVEDIKKEGIKVTTIPIKRKFSPFSDLVSLIKLTRHFKKEKFDVVHTHNLKTELLGQLAARLANVPIKVHTFHGFDFDEDASSFKKNFFLLIDKISLKKTDLVF